MTQCPSHPHTLGATTTDCAACRREARPPNAEYLAAREALRRRPVHHTHPTPPATDLHDTRNRIDEGES